MPRPSQQHRKRDNCLTARRELRPLVRHTCSQSEPLYWTLCLGLDEIRSTLGKFVFPASVRLTISPGTGYLYFRQAVARAWLYYPPFVRKLTQTLARAYNDETFLRFGFSHYFRERGGKKVEKKMLNFYIIRFVIYLFK